MSNDPFDLSDLDDFPPAADTALDEQLRFARSAHSARPRTQKRQYGEANRLAAKMRYAERKAREKQLAVDEMASDHPDLWRWMMDAETRHERVLDTGRGWCNRFALSLAEQVRKGRALSERQLTAAYESMQRDADREAQFKAQRAAEPVCATAMLDALQAIRSSGLKYPRIDCAGYRFSLAPMNGSNAGAMYVKRADGEYLGKVTPDGQLYARIDAAEREQLLAVLADPETALKAHGDKTGQCGVCRRELTNEASIARGIGPICAERMGL